MSTPPRRRRGRPIVGIAVVLAAAAVALVGARDHAGGWNDSSRLATVECLVDHQTLVIDDSTYDATGDKLRIGGHFYSDKSPVPGLLMAEEYLLLRALGLPAAHDDAGEFCWWMTVFSSGLAYVASVWCVWRLGRVLWLPLGPRLALTASFALATVALTYSRQVNNHVFLLAVAAGVMLGLARLARAAEAGRTPWAWLLELGCMAGLGYTIDLGAGPPLLACTGALVVYRCRRAGPVAAFAAAALPWLVLHHAVNYLIGGTLVPANAIPEYLRWPGSTFTAENMTGGWHHTALHFPVYALALLAGKKGFLLHNLPLLLAGPAFVALVLRRRAPERPELLFAAAWSAITWLLYAATSTNYSGLCCSVRWLVPLLAPGYYVLAVALRRRPHLLGDFLLLNGWGGVLAAVLWWRGPWQGSQPALYWAI